MMNLSSITLTSPSTSTAVVGQGGATETPISFSLLMQPSATNPQFGQVTLQSGNAEIPTEDGTLDLMSALSAFLQGEANPTDLSLLATEPLAIDLPDNNVPLDGAVEQIGLLMSTVAAPPPVTPTPSEAPAPSLTTANMSVRSPQIETQANPLLVGNAKAGQQPVVSVQTAPVSVAQTPTLPGMVVSSEDVQSVSQGLQHQTSTPANLITSTEVAAAKPTTTVTVPPALGTAQAPVVSGSAETPQTVQGRQPIQTASQQPSIAPLSPVVQQASALPTTTANVNAPAQPQMPDSIAKISASPQVVSPQPTISDVPEKVIQIAAAANPAKVAPVVAAEAARLPQTAPAIVVSTQIPKPVEIRSAVSTTASAPKAQIGTVMPGVASPIPTSQTVQTTPVIAAQAATSLLTPDAAVPDSVPLADPAQKPTFLTQSDKPAGPIFAPPLPTKEITHATEPLRAEPLSIQMTDNSTAPRTTGAQEVAQKPTSKPFADALMAQVKSVEVSEGRTTVNLHPRGLGNIDIEVIADKDAASKVVVRVENPAVLQALREDRQALAQAINISDSTLLEFQDRGTGEHATDQQDQSSKGGGLLGEMGPTLAETTHQDVVENGQLDILT